MNYIITGKNFVSPLFDSLKTKDELRIMDLERFNQSDLIVSETDKIYSPSAEEIIPKLIGKLDNTNLQNAIKTLQNKYECRKLFSRSFPDFYFKKFSIDQIGKLKLEGDKKYVVKPINGFFGIGVKIIDGSQDLSQIVDEINLELEKNAKYFGENVHSTSEFLVEEFIEGEEYASNLFFDSNGKPVILNICHHPMHEKFEYLHTLYYTNYEIHSKFHDTLVDFMSTFNEDLDARNIAIHAEFKEVDGKLVPIEFNPMRFGGFGYADFTHSAFRINPFQYFFDDLSPNWESIWESKENKNFAWVLGYNGSGLDVNEFEPDREKFKSLFSKILNFYKLDHTKNPAFAIAHVEEEDKNKLIELLNLEFNNFFQEN